jgi:hypothetical protein
MDNFDEENPWVKVSIKDAMDILADPIYKDCTEIHWRPNGEECAMIRRVK